jgi:hypothetical protein
MFIDPQRDVPALRQEGSIGDGGGCQGERNRWILFDPRARLSAGS